ncbi:transcription antiterminator [Oceanobacillus caeni]
MNNRQKELLRLLLLQEGEALQIKDLATKLDCAEKTVRNDLDRLETFLEDYPSARLNRKPGIGIIINIAENDRAEIFRGLLSTEPKTGEERLFEMAFQLLTSQKPLTLKSWADRYYVSNAAIKKDIEIIGQWLEQYELQLVSKQRLGNIVEGPELKKRTALAHLSELVPSKKSVVMDLFLPHEISAMRNALKKMQETFSVTFTDEALVSLTVHALVMIKRTRQKSPVFVQDSEKKAIVERKEFQYANWLFRKLEEEFQLKFPKEEWVYFTWHLISAKRTEEGLEKELQYSGETEKVVQTLIEIMSKLTMFPFEMDSMLANGLNVHMHTVLNRIRYGFPITNPLLSDIKRMYPYMFNMVFLSLGEINRRFPLEIPEDEAAYIVLHFQASIERLEAKREIEKKKALIVCHMGIGMSHLLEAKIKQQYQEIEVVACIGRAELPKFLGEKEVDFIITTVPLEKRTTETVVISPLFTKEDKKKLSEFVEEIPLKKRGQQDRSGFLTLLLKEDLVFLDVEKEHRYQVVEMMATALYEKGYVKKEFIHSAVHRERNSATVIGGGIGIPHGDPTLVKQPVIAAAILKKPLDWGEEQVQLVFMLAITKESQVNIRDIIGKIASLSKAPLVVHELIEANDYQVFLKVLEEN